MDKKEYLIMGATFAFMLIIMGTLFGIIFNLTGYTDINVTSWRYWLGCFLIYTPMIITMILTRNNIPLTSTLGSIINLYTMCAIFSFSKALFFQQSIDLSATLVIAPIISCAIFFAIQCAIQFVAQQEWVKARAEAMKQFFGK